MDRIPIELETFHHVYNRGVDKRIVFEDAKDYRRMLLYLDVLNDTERWSPSTEDMLISRERHSPIGARLVEIIAFCLMPNHFHLLLFELTTGGISKFMQRLGTAYTMYFNEKNERSGALFQGRFKSRYVDNMEYLQKVIDYIHLNPKDLFKPTNNNFSSLLSSYVWSSFPYYTGKPLHTKFINKTVLRDFADVVPPKEYASWLSEKIDFEAIDYLTIDSSKKRLNREGSTFSVEGL